MNNISEHQNVHGQKIGVKYFANTALKSTPGFYGDKPVATYPLYVQVTIKKQTARFKSCIKILVSTEMLENVVNKSSLKTLTNDESNEIKKYLLGLKPFDNHSFSLSQAMKNYSEKLYSVKYLVAKTLVGYYTNSDLASRVVLSTHELRKTDH